MTNVKKAQFSIKWDVRTGSPRKLWRALHDFLDDNGFVHEYEELKAEESAIEGTATFRKSLIGRRDNEMRASFWLLRILIGFLLCLTIILIPLGLALMGSSLKTMVTRVEINVEGEVYRARGTQIDSSHEAEVLDMVADTRVTLKASVGEVVRKKKENEKIKLTRDEREITRFRRDCEKLSRRLEELLPKVSLPIIEPST